MGEVSERSSVHRIREEVADDTVLAPCHRDVIKVVVSIEYPLYLTSDRQIVPIVADAYLSAIREVRERFQLFDLDPNT